MMDGSDETGDELPLDVSAERLQQAVETLEDGGLVVYPTETVYGLGADALEADAVERVFDLKGRNRSNPVSMAFPTVASACTCTHPTTRERTFMERFLPGPVTVVLERAQEVPDVLTAGGDRVGVRVPDHDIALALLERFAPITATSANVSNNPSARRPGELDERIVEGVDVVIDGGETPGGGSTVVDVANETIHRRGPFAEEVEAWLERSG